MEEQAPVAIGCGLPLVNTEEQNVVSVHVSLQVSSLVWILKRNGTDISLVAHAYYPSTDIEAGGSPRGGGHPGLYNEFQTSLGYRVRLCFQEDKTVGLLRWLVR